MKLETKNNIEKYFGGDGKKADEITDTKSKEYFIEWLTENGVKPENIFPTGDFSHIDIVAQTKRGLYGFELKKRRCPSGRYPDAIIDGKKYDQIITAADNFKRGTGDDIKTFVVSFYNDGKMYIWNMEKNFTSEMYRPQHTEVSGNKEYVSTTAHHYIFSDGYDVTDDRIKIIYS